MSAFHTAGAEVRHRVHVAQKRLRRLEQQRKRFATEYARADTPQARLAAATATLRAAAAERDHRGRPELATRLDHITAQITALINELHEASERGAHRTLRAEQRRLARNETVRNETVRNETVRNERTRDEQHAHFAA